jgi:hypothetical protein
MDNVKQITPDAPPLQELRTYEVYRIRHKLNEGGVLTKDDKKYLGKEINYHSHYENAIYLRGYLFSFADIIHHYMVKVRGKWVRHSGTDKATVRDTMYNSIYITKIIEL